MLGHHGPRLSGLHPDTATMGQLNAVVKVTARREIANRDQCPIPYYISSLAGQAKTLLSAHPQPLEHRNSLHWSLDVTFREDHSRVVRPWPPESGCPAPDCPHLLKQETTLKRGIQGKRLKAGWVEDYLLKVLLG